MTVGHADYYPARLATDLPWEGEEVVSAITREDLERHGLQQVAAFVHLPDVIIGEFGTLAHGPGSAWGACTGEDRVTHLSHGNRLDISNFSRLKRNRSKN